MAHLLRTGAAVLLGIAALTSTPAHATPAPPPPVTVADLPHLTAELARVTAHAQALSDQLDQAAAEGDALQVALDRAQQAHDAAVLVLDQRVRQVYMSGTQDPVAAWSVDLAAPELRSYARKVAAATVTVDASLVDAVGDQSAALRPLLAQEARFHQRLLSQAQAVLADQDTARGLLAEAQALAAHDAAVQARLAAQQALLDTVSSTVTLALTPAQTERTRAAANAQAPVLALLERAGSGLPEGYAISGTGFEGTASWYGPGFVGHPTASGAPYDPEQLTCAHKTLPLGTVIHVSANGLSVNCLVNDRGPYVGDRVLDMSRAGSRDLGYGGLAQVTVEVLVPTG